MKIKEIIKNILIFGGIIGMIICAVMAAVFHFQNPDMTDLRMFMEYPGPTIWAIVCYVCSQIGINMGK